ncbi:MAG: 3-deoxy-7-phosphoheptulonate synthase [Myxococcales bacterium]|nr:3-deoxy-7-phosphoheptulonate synthase [Myxococcales bacterium]MCB9523241.1 3-deoxy-7-phosphoheptulonate synthase [Myxococcales bacterium]
MSTVLILDPAADAKAVGGALKRLGQWASLLEGPPRAYRLDPPSAPVTRAALAAVPGVAQVLVPASPHPRVDGQAHRAVPFGPVAVGGDAPPVFIAGPCSVESLQTAHEAAAAAAHAGARLLRGGAYKPRTSPYSFQGKGSDALGWLREAADAHGLGVVTEVLSEPTVDAVAGAADVLQVGSRNMQNFALLKAVGAAGMPVLLKRAMAATLEEWLLAGEYLLDAGAPSVVFCERGIKGFDPQTRNLLDLGAVAVLAHAMGQPVLVDPSHATGRRDLVPPLTAAALAAGAAGVMVEYHPDPAQALSDGPQALDAAGLAAVAAHFPGSAR